MNEFLEPVYLGKSTLVKGKGSSESFFFFASKNGVGRFLKYSNYPYWAAAANLPDFLVLGEAPENVVKEVKAFILGRLEFEVIPKTRGRSEKVLRREVSYNEENGVSNGSTSSPEGFKPTNTVTDSGRATKSSGEPSKDYKAEVQSVHEKASKDSNSSRHSISSPPKGSGGTRSEVAGRLPPIFGGLGSNEVRRLPSDESGRSPGTRGNLGNAESQHDASSGSSQRREPLDRILGNGRNDTGPVPQPTSTQQPSHGSIDGNDLSSLKPKRVRRTKAELTSGRSLEEIRVSREG